jgi:hypothetical protein
MRMTTKGVKKHICVWKRNTDYTHTCVICGKNMINKTPKKLHGYNEEYNERMLKRLR